MGLLDSLLGGLTQGGLGGVRQDSSGSSGLGGIGGMAIAAVILQLLQRNGGLQGVLQRMQQGGLGQQAQSWIGTGQNQPISPDAVSQIFGQGQLSQIAQELGLSHEQAASTVAQALPQVVDSMTPQGAIPGDHDDLVARTLQDLQQRRGA
jgi:uncharacterized protein YidB (DUF937 family)